MISSSAMLYSILVASTVHPVSAASSRYADFGECTVIDGAARQGRDWISHRCDGIAGLPIWLTNSDSTRSALGFGARANMSGMFNAERDQDWPLELRGVEGENGFQPHAVIVRMMRPRADVATDGIGLLFVYRLREDGTSCLIASDLRSHEKAREIADAATEEFVCTEEPQIPAD